MITQETIAQWNEDFHDKSPFETLSYFAEKFRDRIIFASSLGMEDQVLTEMISRLDEPINIFTLDTGRLFPETYDLISTTNVRYKVNIEIYFPDAGEVEQMVHQKGVNLFYNSISDRKLCCYIRKMKPLSRALQGQKVWITGLRRHQSVTRNNSHMIEWDENNELLKINPLINWSDEDVKGYVEKHKIPVSPLHKKGFASIGCQPCTRAIVDGEDIRAGRWWWENPESKECGLHQK
ncbi:MAG: phosphoadenylyl-sulfate reductase [bacterium]|jgi:phosphoadenosine phosphosulfate reductase